jgi:SAM-dependent methyltransferase
VTRPPDAPGAPWTLLGLALDGPLHPGGTDATAALLDRSEVDAGTRLLDVGCGAGEALELARERGADPVGLDRRPAAPGSVAGDLTALPFRTGSVDVVLGEVCALVSPTSTGRWPRPGGS